MLPSSRVTLRLATRTSLARILNQNNDQILTQKLPQQHKCQSFRLQQNRFFCETSSSSSGSETPPKPSKPSLVIFDKDGTLICFHAMWTNWAITTAEKIESATNLKRVDLANQIYKELGFDPVKRRVVPGMLASDTNDQIMQKMIELLVRHDVSQDEARQTVLAAVDEANEEAKTEGKIHELHNLRHLFETLKDHDIKIAVCTSDSRPSTEHTIQKLGLADLIDVVVCGDDHGTLPKPSPHNALKICAQLGVDPKEAYMVGDTRHDVKMARSASLGGSVGVLSGVETEEHLAPHSDHIIEHVGHLMPVLHKAGAIAKVKPKPSDLTPAGQSRSVHTSAAGTSNDNGTNPFVSGQRRHLSWMRPKLNELPDGARATHIIIGAGSAGCVLANRLTEDPDNKVVLVETGPRDDPWWYMWKMHMPAALMYNLCNDNYNWYYHTVPQAHANNRVMYWPRGRVWGGSSSLNAMCYVRGHAADYDRWGEEGAEGWSYSNCLPYFKKAETFDKTKGPDDPYRGYNGPLQTKQGSAENPLHQAWMKAGIESGYGYTDDANGYRQEGNGHMDMTIDPKGYRASASRCYLWPALSRPNLYTINLALTTRIIFNGKRAIGIEYAKLTAGNKMFTETRMDTSNRHKLYAESDVILCGGAINSPQLLMLSGIGPGEDLTKLEFEVLQDTPGVGENLQDHLELYVQYACKQPITLYDKSSWKFPHNMIKIGLQWFSTGTGLGATNHLESGGFVRSQPGVPHPDIQFHFLPSTVHDHGRKLGNQHAYQVHVGPLRATSRGTLRLQSNDPRMHPLLDPNYLATEQDRKEFRDCVRIARDVMTQPAFDPFRGTELQPGDRVNTDAEIDAFVRKECDSAYHPSCTAKMGSSKDNMAVVDGATMKVHGFEGLRVVDASVMPSIASGNLNAPVIMMAERAADLIRFGKQQLPPSTAKVWQPPTLESTKAG